MGYFEATYFDSAYFETSPDDAVVTHIGRSLRRMRALELERQLHLLGPFDDEFLSLFT